MEHSSICNINVALDTIREIAVTNQDAGLAIGLALAIAIICYGISRSAAVVIRAWRS
ncbi:MAG: hypothetical protein AAGA60_25190 [Cyanobacteria bacterium P01_E01_bin.42]